MNNDKRKENAPAVSPSKMVKQQTLYARDMERKKYLETHSIKETCTKASKGEI